MPTALPHFSNLRRSQRNCVQPIPTLKLQQNLRQNQMWSGKGTRERKKAIVFSEAFIEAPTVHVSMSLLDLDKDTNVRADVQAKNIKPTGFDLIFRTWGDTRIARIRLSWIAMGGLRDEDEWDVS